MTAKKNKPRAECTDIQDIQDFFCLEHVFFCHISSYCDLLCNFVIELEFLYDHPTARDRTVRVHGRFIQDAQWFFVRLAR